MSDNLRKTVHESLDSAVVNGYELYLWSCDDIVRDLHEYDSALEHVPTDELKPLVQEWIDKKTER